jgi:tRNA modification GTPase
MTSSADTIAAVATPPGRGGVGVIRMSGDQVPEIAQRLLGRLPRPRLAELHLFNDGQGRVIDQGLCLYFPAPHSFTGEHVLELQGHGGPVVMDVLLGRLLELGARQARPGEFSERAFLNDKLDLTQAEAIADLIDASTEQAARAASRSLQGVFSSLVQALVESLVRLRMYVEAAIDFPEEEVDFLSDGEVQQQLAVVIKELEAVQRQAHQGCLLREGMTLVLAGRPNAGKSSLLNALAGRDSAIVTSIAGTTRDVLREHIQIDGMPLHIIDTAGLRDSSDPIEKEGVRRAWSQIEQADRLLLIIDDEAGFSDQDETILARLPPSLPHTLVYNKIDVSGRPAGVSGRGSDTDIALSALTGEGMEDLRRHLKEVIGYSESAVGSFTVRRRHMHALRGTALHLKHAQNCLNTGAGELLAEELRLAQQQLSQITGEFTSDDLLGEIFAGFCIGK